MFAVVKKMMEWLKCKRNVSKEIRLVTINIQIIKLIILTF